MPITLLACTILTLPPHIPQLIHNPHLCSLKILFPMFPHISILQQMKNHNWIIVLLSSLLLLLLWTSFMITANFLKNGLKIISESTCGFYDTVYILKNRNFHLKAKLPKKKLLRNVGKGYTKRGSELMACQCCSDSGHVQTFSFYIQLLLSQ